MRCDQMVIEIIDLIYKNRRKNPFVETLNFIKKNTVLLGTVSGIHIIRVIRIALYNSTFFLHFS